MSKIKKHIIKGMNKIMLDCNHATLFITKREYVKLGVIEKIKLALHLATCKYCQQYSEQSAAITHHIAELSRQNNEKQLHQLSEEQKTNINIAIDKQQLK